MALPFLSIGKMWMRIASRLSALLPAIALAACSDPVPGAGDNNVDVAAAASRAQSDIANYAAVHRAEPEAAASPVKVPQPREPLAEPAAIEAADAVVRRYFAAIADRRYDEAWALWDGGGAASGMSRDAFAASFARFATYRATVGTPTDPDAGAGQRYVTVPVVVTGTLQSGEPFRLEGPVVLHTIAAGIESDAPDAHAWRIRNSELKPRPLAAQKPAS